MIKYILEFDNQKIEFASLEEAQIYKLNRSVEAEIIEYNEPDIQQILPVPNIVTPRQIRLALINFGISLDAIENIINSLPEPQKSITKITWEYSIEIQRYNPLLISLAPILNLTEDQIDDLFRLAATL